MSEEPQEGQLVKSGMSAEEMAALSAPRETEGEAPESTKEFSTISFEDIEDCCKDADAKADDREDIPAEASE